jgi:hypothetical protein
MHRGARGARSSHISLSVENGIVFQLLAKQTSLLNRQQLGCESILDFQVLCRRQERVGGRMWHVVSWPVCPSVCLAVYSLFSIQSLSRNRE